MHVFMTGATGFIGSAVAKILKDRGHKVVALVRTKDNAMQLQALGYRPVIGDMRHPETWAAEAATAEALIHAAWIRPGRLMGMRWVRAAQEADTIAFRDLIEAAKRGGRCCALVDTSGVSVHGDHGNAWIDEDTPPTPGAIGNYHLSGEQLALQAYREGLPAFSLRPGTVYAPSDTFANFFLAPAAKGKLNYVGNGENFMPTVHLADLAEAYALAVEKPPVGKVVSLVDDEPLRMKALAAILLNEFGGGRARGVPVWLVSLLGGRPLAQMLTGSYRVKNTRAKALLGWKPRHSTYREGIKEVVAEYKEQLRLTAHH